MRLISYDIGIKNLAYCVIEYTDNQLSILDWNVLNLLEKEDPVEQCSQMVPGKTKKLPACKCTKTAKFTKDQQFYCDKHAKKSNFIVPTKKHSRPYLKKLKVPDLLQLMKGIVFFGLENLEKQKKDEMIDKIFQYYEKQCLEPIIKKKTENAGDADLIQIGKRMKALLNENPLTQTITNVMIENQISPIATRMKTLQGMVTQYYIDHIDTVDITFVSSVHKLKQFQGSDHKTPPSTKNKNENDSTKLDEKNLTNSITIIPIETALDIISEQSEVVNKKGRGHRGVAKLNVGSLSYKDHKVSGITYCSQILDKNPGFSSWSSKMDTKKKDDLADCFLQGLWYFKQKNIITYADDFTISYTQIKI